MLIIYAMLQLRFQTEAIAKSKESDSVINVPSMTDPHYMVSVFKTNVSNRNQANALVRSLKKQFPEGKFHFDLEDTDRVFRIEYKKDIIQEIMQLFKGKQFICEMLL